MPSPASCLPESCRVASPGRTFFHGNHHPSGPVVLPSGLSQVLILARPCLAFVDGGAGHAAARHRGLEGLPRLPPRYAHHALAVVLYPRSDVDQPRHAADRLGHVGHPPVEVGLHTARPSTAMPEYTASAAKSRSPAPSLAT